MERLHNLLRAGCKTPCYSTIPHLFKNVFLMYSYIYVNTDMCERACAHIGKILEVSRGLKMMDRFQSKRFHIWSTMLNPV